MLITYLKHANEPTAPLTPAAQISFTEFYANLANNNQPAPAYNSGPLFPDPVFRTFEVTSTPGPIYDNLTIKLNRFNTQFRALLSMYRDTNMQSCYDTFRIPKRSGGTRTINAPKPELSKILTDLNAFFKYANILPHNCAYAYVPHRNVKNALETHQKRGFQWFMKIDLHDFFGSCNKTFIEQQLNHIPFFHHLPTGVRDDLLHICMLNDGLPQGSPLSPWLTNQIMLPIDFKLNRLCRQHNICYTRYADDMLFSSTSKNAVQRALPLVTEVLQGTPLTINNEKTRISSVYGQNWNLGLMLNKDNQITVGNKRKETFRAILHNFCKHPEQWHYAEATELLGKLQYYMSIEPEYFQGLLTKYNQKFNINIRAKIIAIIKG